MTKQQGLEKLFNPQSIAVIGASRDQRSVGYGVLKSLVRGCVLSSDFCKAFKGKVYAVNPNADFILGVRCYPNLKKIEGSVDLAVICVPAAIVPSVMNDCAKAGVPFAVIVSAGFAELGEKGKKLQDDVLKIAAKAGIRVVGPNCLGIIRPCNNVNASFAPTMPPDGAVGFITQSGALADSIIDWAVQERYGLSAVISYGNQADLDLPDFMEFLAEDQNTKAIAVYLEGVKDGRKFMETAKKVTKKKPVIVLKAGRTDAGSRAVSSHTGTLAGSYRIYEAAFRQCGIEIANTIEELFDLAKVLAYQPVCRENAVGIITNGGGCGVLCADACDSLGVNVVELKPSTIAKLDKSGKMHPAYSRRNPLDLVGDALPERYAAAVNTLLEESYIHGLIVIQTLQTMTDPKEDAREIIEAAKKFPQKPVICTYMGGLYSKQGGRLLESNNIPDLNDVSKSARTMLALIRRAEYLKKK